MKRTWTIIGVADVPQSLKWYQSLLGLPETAPAHDYFGQILDSDGTYCSVSTSGVPTSIRR
jgi:catechol 2,3-dioxygenase-like lactoylglutathione lyase family enzyme